MIPIPNPMSILNIALSIIWNVAHILSCMQVHDEGNGSNKEPLTRSFVDLPKQ